MIADKVSIDDQNFELKATNHEGSLDTDDPSDLLNGVVSGGTDETTLTDYPLDIDLQSATSDSRDYTDSFDIVVPIMSVS